MRQLRQVFGCVIGRFSAFGVSPLQVFIVVHRCRSCQYSRPTDMSLSENSVPQYPVINHYYPYIYIRTYIYICIRIYIYIYIHIYLRAAAPAPGPGHSQQGTKRQPENSPEQGEPRTGAGPVWGPGISLEILPVSHNCWKKIVGISTEPTTMGIGMWWAMVNPYYADISNCMALLWFVDGMWADAWALQKGTILPRFANNGCTDIQQNA